MKSFNSLYVASWPAVAQAWQHKVLGQTLLLMGTDDDVRRLAEAIARQLLCEATGEVGCTCRSCLRKLEEHPDLVHVQPEKMRIRRERLVPVLHSLFRLPLWAPRQVVWIEQADSMTEATQNYLLKSLEEPPPYVTFILATNQPAGLLETVRSRCQIVRAPRTPEQNALDQKFSPDKLLEQNPLTPTGVIDLAYWAKARFRETGNPGYLSLWDAAFQAFHHMESNGNAEIAREILASVYSHVR
ncbi:MAG: hypothetical protein C7B44_07975 [Sulfobacillus thermosulfidooxidans]|nr:MAG: hypothetical protein C7B44_07975 [Sulfobacillus thermosulfidooxidans]